VRLTRDGVAGPTTLRRLHKAKHRPTPWSRVYKHIEVHKSKQVLLMIGKGGKVMRAIHVSTAAPGHVTPSGHFRIYRKELMSWSKPFQVWLPYASYFYGGDAFHQYPSVPGYPASHGCVRIYDLDAIVVYQFATVGTRVVVS
jgi:lipoprotein-anchoring transpeptidase ErfK/SrfK